MKMIVMIALLALSLPALAHPDHAGASGMLAGLAHPVTGIDHLLAMLATGLWSRQQQRGAWTIALCVAMMAAGALLQTALPLVAGLEAALAASVALAGALLLWAGRLPGTVVLALASLFALLHGQAHGRELAGAGALAGFLISSAALLAAGRMAGAANRDRTAGGVIGAVGLCLLAGVA